MSGKVLLTALAQGRHIPKGFRQISTTATWFARMGQAAKAGFEGMSKGHKAATAMAGLASVGLVGGMAFTGSPANATTTLAGQSPALDALAQQAGVSREQLVQELMPYVQSAQPGQPQQATAAAATAAGPQMDPASIAQSYRIQPQAAAQLLQAAQQLGLDPNNPTHHSRLHQAFLALRSGDPSRIKFVGYHLAGKSPGDGVNYDHIGRMFSQSATMT